MLTVMVPTINRPDFLIRLLRYYEACRFPYTLAIGDSSDEERARPTRVVLAELEGKLKINYFSCPELNDAQTIRFLIERLETPYAVFVADDDFLVPEGLAAAARFLDDHPDYAAAHGQGIIAVLQDSGSYGRFSATGLYRQPVLEQAAACDRLQALMRNYSVPLFSVHRTATWRRMYRRTADLEDKTFTELLAVALSAVSGKIKQVEGLSLVRQAHDRRYFLPDSFDWVTGPRWAASYAAFQQDLVEALVEQDHVPPARAAEVVKEAFWGYLSTAMTRHYSRNYRTAQAGWKRKLKSAVKTVPGVSREVLPRWHSLRAQMRHREDLTLRGLLKPSSCYYRDFQVIYQLVTEGSIGERSIS